MDAWESPDWLDALASAGECLTLLLNESEVRVLAVELKHT